MQQYRKVWLKFTPLTQFTCIFQCSHEQTVKWFWSVVEKMTPTEQHDLLYFWTSFPVRTIIILSLLRLMLSQSLPATQAGFAVRPTIVVRPPSETHLPTANTCVARLMIPVYSSKRLLRAKLLAAIQTKNFGFV